MKAAIRWIVLASLLGQALVVGGCYNCAKSLRAAMADCKLQRSVRADFPPGSKLIVRDADGAIRVTAGDVTDCQVTACVFIHAPTKREAQEIGEQLEVVAEPNEGTVVIAVRKPKMTHNKRFVSADLDIFVPRRADIECRTTFGHVTVVGPTGSVTAATELGDVVCENVHGSADLRTQLGDVICRELVAHRLVARTQKGSIDVTCADACPADIVADASTEWGKVRFKAPPRYQGALELESELGSVKLDTAANVRGRFEKSLLHDQVSGRIGSGEGKLRLFTNLGSVVLR